jgi:predicted phosphodiesterase
MNKKKLILTSDLHYGVTDSTSYILDEFYRGVLKDEPDYLIIAGDIISHEQKQWDEAFRQLRSYFSVPILTVLGNHDLWQSYGKKSIWQLRTDIITKMKKYDITYLPDDPVLEETFRIYGFDGWYGCSEPPSRDLEFMHSMIEGVPTHNYLKKQSLRQLLSIPKKSDVQQVVVTHFDYTSSDMSADTKWLNLIDERADILCVGHSHIHRFDNMMSMQIVNCGSDYDKPKKIKLWGGW